MRVRVYPQGCKPSQPSLHTATRIGADASWPSAMGCAGSKEAVDETSHKDIETNVAAPTGAGAASNGSFTQSGYHSDVQGSTKHAFTEQLVLPRHCCALATAALAAATFAPAAATFALAATPVTTASLSTTTRTLATAHTHHVPPRQVTNNIHKIHEVYDLTHSTTLGRGACGSVSTCKHIATQALYAMKTVSIEGMVPLGRTLTLTLA